MTPGRLIRKLFPRPPDISNTWSQSTEKFVFIDEAKAPVYSLVGNFFFILELLLDARFESLWDVFKKRLC